MTAALEVSFDVVYVKLGSGRHVMEKVFEHEDAQACLQGKKIYVARSKWRIKLEDLVDLKVKGNSMLIKTLSKEFELLNAKNMDAWERFRSKAQEQFSKYQSPSSVEFHNFMSSTEKRGLGKSRRVPTVRKQAFGSRGRKVVPVHNSWLPEFSDDEIEPRKPSHETSIVVSKSVRGDEIHVAREDKKNTSNTNDLEADTDSKIRPAAVRKNRIAEKYGRRTILDDESDSDEDVFGTATLTTPAAQRIVSPATLRKQDESDSAEESLEFEQKSQLKISNFFQPSKDDRSSFDSRTAVLKSSTPQPSKQFFSPAAARIVQSANKKRSLTQESSWLKPNASQTPSSLERRKTDLFGKSTPSKQSNEPIEEFPSSDSKRLSPLRVLKRPRLPLLEAPTNQVASTAVKTNLSSQLDSLAFAEPPAIKRNILRGLINLGNTCYMNASLQMLCTLTSFVDQLSGHGGTLAKSVVAVAQELAIKDNAMPVDPTAVKRAIDDKTEKFMGYEQRDAHEFASDLIDLIHEELVEEAKTDDESLPATAKMLQDGLNQFPTDDFRLTLQVSLQCMSCGYKRSKDEIYRHLSIDIEADRAIQCHLPSQASVEKALERFFEPEVREIQCEKCSEGKKASQTLRILSSPKVLLLHLKRFIIVEKRRQSADIDENLPPNTQAAFKPVEYEFQKNRAPVSFPGKLSLDSFQEGQPSLSTYSLRSVVHHIGSRASSGHYTADGIRMIEPASPPEGIGNRGEAWVSFDDRSSGIIPLERVLDNQHKQSTAYMLVYERHRMDNPCNT